MTRKPLLILGGVLASLAATVTPAAAHTGSVECDATGVVFHYNANFERDTYVTENVGDAQRLVLVRAHQSGSDTWLGVTGTVTAGASWRYGSIPTRTLECPAPPTPPPAAPPAPPAAPPVVTPPAAPPAPPAVVTPPAAPPAIPTPPVKKLPKPKCPRYTYRISYRHGVLVCGKNVIKIRVVHDHKPKRATPVPPGGVTG
jgi:hypothetical protein